MAEHDPGDGPERRPDIVDDKVAAEMEALAGLVGELTETQPFDHDPLTFLAALEALAAAKDGEPER